MEITVKSFYEQYLENFASVMRKHVWDEPTLENRELIKAELLAELFTEEFTGELRVDTIDDKFVVYVIENETMREFSVYAEHILGQYLDETQENA